MKNFLLGFGLAGLLLSGGFWVYRLREGSGLSVHTAGTADQKIQRYHCPMHPTIVSNKAGDCPICGMALVPLEANPQEEAGHPPPPGPITVPKEGLASPDYAPVFIPPERQRLMGLQTEEARVLDLSQPVRTVGKVAVDETRIQHVHTKFDGTVEKIFADFTGKAVHQGDPLVALFSPELMAAQREYLLALKSREQWGADVQLPGIDLVGSARQRLSFWDISAAQLEELERTRAPLRALTLYSPASGIVNAKYAVQGMRVSPADILYDIIDLSSIWVLADLYEIHLPMVKLGTPALVSLPYHPGRQWRGKVSFLEPVLDAQTRTIKARLDFPNPGGMLKPAMYVDVEFQGSAGRGVAVPESAVMTTGERALVFVTRKTHHFEPRVVQLGVQAKGFYEIKAGVKAGERVVTGANFLLDSESRLKAAIAGQ